ncbi:MAG: hypothetical protein KJ601_07585 [Nanoarchaeota archaeon]|nr:hypothetical protein [Nanoarchaeota archaeon]MBU1704707.1 hypothetical protein [Nanoarchaeota archaeon]
MDDKDKAYLWQSLATIVDEYPDDYLLKLREMILVRALYVASVDTREPRDYSAMVDTDRAIAEYLEEKCGDGPYDGRGVDHDRFVELAVRVNRLALTAQDNFCMGGLSLNRFKNFCELAVEVVDATFNKDPCYESSTLRDIREVRKVLSS